MICPRCKLPLVTEKISDISATVEVDKCPSCNGMWFQEGELTELEKIIEPTFFEFRKILPKKYQLKPLTCPSCQNLQVLQKAEHPRDKKVIIDYCPVCHGIWLDNGELEAIQKENWLQTIGKIFKWLTSKDQ